MSRANGPHGNLDDLQKCAAFALALAMARGALIDALQGDLSDARNILDLTSTAGIAAVLGCRQGDLSLDWNEHLTDEIVGRMKGF